MCVSRTGATHRRATRCRRGNGPSLSAVVSLLWYVFRLMLVIVRATDWLSLVLVLHSHLSPRVLQQSPEEESPGRRRRHGRAADRQHQERHRHAPHHAGQPTQSAGHHDVCSAVQQRLYARLRPVQHTAGPSGLGLGSQRIIYEEGRRSRVHAVGVCTVRV